MDRRHTHILEDMHTRIFMEISRDKKKGRRQYPRDSEGQHSQPMCRSESEDEM
jgi:hypothetical protein